MACRLSIFHIVFVAWAVGAAMADQGGDYARLMNLGKAHLENRNAAKSVETFSAVVELNPESPEGWRNLARAQLLARKADEALTALARARTIEPDSAATAYLEGLAQTRAARFPEAIKAFENAARIDPENPTVRFQLACAYQAAEKHDEAKIQLNETLRLDPLHASAHFKLAGYARKERDREGFQKHQREFMRLRQVFGDEARSAEALEMCIYTKPEPWAPSSMVRTVAPPTSTIEVTFKDATQAWLPAPARKVAATDVLAVDDTGRCVLVLAGMDGKLSRVVASQDGPASTHAINMAANIEGVRHCIVGDFFNETPTDRKYDPKLDAHEDLMLVTDRGVRLYKYVASDEFVDVTATSGLPAESVAGARWADFDHDGDLDLLLAGETGLQVWQNNGDGRFENVTETVGIGATGPVRSAVAVDLDEDVAIDLVVARGGEPTIVYKNQRAGRYARMAEPPGPLPPADVILADDLDNNGFADLVLMRSDGATVVYGRTATRKQITFDQVVASRGALLDYDNDGWLDLLIVGHDKSQVDKGAAQLWRNAGSGDWVDASQVVGLDKLDMDPLSGVTVGDLDGDGDTDLALTTANKSLRLVRNDGGHVNGQLKVRLTSIKTNPSAIGTHIEALAGSFWITRAVHGKPIEMGLGGREQIDTVQTVWTNGVVDNQLDVKVAASPLDIVEKNVATGSCPYLYAWDGKGFRFVTDLLGNSPLGLSIKRDVVLAADPDEIVYAGTDHDIVPRDGRYLFEVTEETRELLYFDFAKLIVVDHPSQWELHSTDKLMEPPFPDSELLAMASPRPLLSAAGDDGVDRTRALAAADGVFAPPGTPLPSPYRGMCHPLALTMDFGPIEPDQPNVLALTGWLQYGDASRNIAMSQNKSLTIISPTLEIETAPDVWTSVDVVVGMPAGKTKTILVDLSGKLPGRSYRLRLTTTFEIRWDRIALFTKQNGDRLDRHELLPSSANLYHRGFSDIRSRAPGHPPTPAYDDVSLTPPWRTTPEGWCTRLGDVAPLLAARDEKLVIVNAGDAVTLAFDASDLPPRPHGLQRSFFLYTVGWDKDADHNVLDGERVEPLPITETYTALDDESALQDWRLKYNTRWVPRDQFVPMP